MVYETEPWILKKWRVYENYTSKTVTYRNLRCISTEHIVPWCPDVIILVVVRFGLIPNRYTFYKNSVPGIPEPVSEFFFNTHDLGARYFSLSVYLKFTLLINVGQKRGLWFRFLFSVTRSQHKLILLTRFPWGSALRRREGNDCRSAPV